MSEPLSDAEARYKLQRAIVEALRKQWVKEGKPLTGEGGATGRATVIHPLLVELQAAMVKADRLEKSLAGRRMGRPVGASSAPDRAPKLRAVK